MKSEANKKKNHYRKVMSNQQENEVALSIFNKLHSLYPGHAWIVQVDNNLCYIKHMLLSAKYGMTTDLFRVTQADNKELMRIGGELLERFNVDRGAMNLEHVMGLKQLASGDAKHYE